ncbi:MAG: hypothetical protein ACRDZQ_12830 [Acidimicrobiales bacterium]
MSLPVRLAVRTAVLGVGASLGLVAGVEASPAHAHLAAGLWAVVVTAVVARALLLWARPPGRPDSAFDRPPRPRPPAPARPPGQLVALERMVSQSVLTAGDAHHRLLPLLRRLDRGAGPSGVGTGRGGDERHSYRLERATELLRPEDGAGAPIDRMAPGLDLDTVEALVTLVERRAR